MSQLVNPLPIDATRTIAIKLVTDSVSSDHTRRAYKKALHDFFDWRRDIGTPPFIRANVLRYKSEVLEPSGQAASTLNQKIVAIRKLAQEAADNGLLDQSIATGIANVKGFSNLGRRTGNWLDKHQAAKLINAPDTSTNKGRRDRAILATMIGSGLRRSEMANLTHEHIQQREGRWVIVDIIGKHGRVRSVPMAAFAKAAIDNWAPDTTGRVFRAVNRGDNIYGDKMTPQAIHDVVKQYGEALDVDVAPHDLRRTFSKLAHKGGAGIEQIQLSLGHASIKTTERYIGAEQDLHDAPCDKLGLKL